MKWNQRLAIILLGLFLVAKLYGGQLPFVPTGPLKVVVFVESNDIDNLPQGQRDIVSSRVVREKVEGAGHEMQVLDRDSLVDNPANAEWKTAIGSPVSPVVARRPKDGGTIKVDPLPDTPEAFYALLGVK